MLQVGATGIEEEKEKKKKNPYYLTAKLREVE
jgi:hypothetical protein